MPFVKVDVKKQIEEQRQKDPEFRKAWDESREEYELIGKANSIMKKINISPKGTSWDDFERQMYTPEEIAESKKRREIIEKLYGENHSKFFIDTMQSLFEAAEIKLGRSLTATEMQNIINQESIN